MGLPDNGYGGSIRASIETDHLDNSMTNFWHILPKPFFCLAPMEDVTDTVFRRMITTVCKPNVMFTEFTNVDAILHNETQRLLFNEIERPLVAQIWGTDPGKFSQAAAVIDKLNFDGIDINFGCPVREVVKQGACSALIGQNKQVAEIITATRKGAKGLPISVKTRLGITQAVTQDWIGFLLSQNLAAITIHCRTAAEKSDVPAHWDEIAKAVLLRNTSRAKTLIVGNGDIQTLSQAKEYAEKYRVDGVMIGRAVLHNPALFAAVDLSPHQRFDLFIRHIELFESIWGKKKNFAILKKFVKAYITGFKGASGVRQQLMATQDLSGLKSKAKELMQ